MAKKLEQEYRQIDKKIRAYRLKNILTTICIILYIAIIILEILALFQLISFVWGLIPFMIATIIKYYLTKNNTNKKE